MLVCYSISEEVYCPMQNAFVINVVKTMVSASPEGSL
jgi:hypothetical protein